MSTPELLGIGAVISLVGGLMAEATFSWFERRLARRRKAASTERGASGADVSGTLPQR
ncbi:MAG: hypothetical protein ACKVVT_09045 [Dehalococcoidia bacterium]